MHYSLLVIHSADESVDELLYPYEQLDFPEDELLGDPRTSFEPMVTANYLRSMWNKWEAKQPFKNEEGKMVNPGDFKWKSFESLDEFAKYWNGYIRGSDDREYGFFHNIDEKYGYYNKGTGYLGFKMKEGKECFSDLGKEVQPEGFCAQAKIKNIQKEFLKKKWTAESVLSGKWHTFHRFEKNTDLTRKFDQFPEKISENEVLEYVRYGNCGSAPEEDYYERICRLFDTYYEKKGKGYRLKPKYSGNRNIKENESESNWFRETAWNQKYYDTFLKDLHPETILTTVDYYV